ncbi:MAG: STAS domain-containing protein [Pseudomonadota bacterium]
MELSSSDVADTRVVKVIDTRIDAAVAIQFKDAMRAETEGGPERVVLDLSEVSFIDSSGLGAVVAAKKLLNGSHVLELAGLTPVVDKVFKLTRMDSVFAIHSDVNAAVPALAS